MKMTGWCVSCRKIKMVRVHAYKLANGKNIPMGVCSDCELRDKP